jgi:hypothetical protein
MMTNPNSAFLRLMLVLPLLHGMSSVFAAVSDEELGALTCGQSSAEKMRASSPLKRLEAQAKTTDDGAFSLPGPFAVGSVCIRNINVSGSFGVLFVSGEVCGADMEALKQFVLARNSDLKPVEDAKIPGLLASYQTPKRSIVFFRGSPAFQPTPDPTSSRISYFCTFAASGPQ